MNSVPKKQRAKVHKTHLWNQMGMLMRKFLGVFIYLFWLPIFTTYLILSNLLPML